MRADDEASYPVRLSRVHLTRGFAAGLRALLRRGEVEAQRDEVNRIMITTPTPSVRPGYLHGASIDVDRCHGVMAIR